MVVIAWRKLVIAGIAGYACGKSYVWLKKYPDTVKPILYCSAVSGTAGVLLGLGVSAYRDLPSHVYALSTGANFAIVTAAFLGIRQLVVKPLLARETTASGFEHRQETSYPTFPHTLSQVEYVSSGTSGGIAVAMATILSRRGVRSAVLSGCVGVGVALLGQLSYNQFERWRKRKAIEIHYPELSESKSKTNWSFANFESWFMGFWHRRSKGVQIDTDIVLLTESIKDEKRQLEQLDQLLREKGVDPAIIETQSNCSDTKTDSGGDQSTESPKQGVLDYNGSSPDTR